MKNLTTKWITVIALLAATTGSVCMAEKSQLKLQNQSITVYPIVLGRADKADDADTIQFGTRIAEVLGLLLEQRGMQVGISEDYPDAAGSDDSQAQIEQKVQAFVAGKSEATDYTLFARCWIKPAGRGPAIDKICAVVTDHTGQIVWSKEITDLPEREGCSPMGACMVLQSTLRDASDLKEPDPDNVPYGPLAELMDQRNGLPPQPERDAMEQRFEAARDSFAESSLSVYPFRIWETEAGSDEGANDLADQLTKAGLFRASATDTDTQLVATRDPEQPSQMKILWDTARDFRAYLREHPADTDYALLVDASIDPVRHVHLILCEGSGEWVATSLMNSHHPEFKEMDRETLDDCVALALQRLQSTLNE